MLAFGVFWYMRVDGQKERKRLTDKHALVDVEVLGALETLRRTLLNVSNMLIGEVLGDPCIANSMVEDVARVCKCSSSRNSQVGFGHVLFVPLVEPRAQCLFDVAFLTGVPQRYRMPDSHKRDLEETQLFQSLFGELMEMGEPDEGTLLVLTVVVGFGVTTEGKLRLVLASFEESL